MGIELSEFMTDLPAEKLAIRGMNFGDRPVNRLMKDAPEDVEFSLNPEEGAYTGMVLDGVIVTLVPGKYAIKSGVQVSGSSPCVTFSVRFGTSWEEYLHMVRTAADACRKLSELL